MAIKVHHGIVLHPDALRFQLLLHRRKTAKMKFTGQETVPVHHPMRRDAGVRVARIERVAHCSRRTVRPQGARQRAVVRHAAYRYAAHQRVHPFVEIRRQFTHGWEFNGGEFKRKRAYVMVLPLPANSCS